jgi:hypothetical protein
LHCELNFIRFVDIDANGRAALEKRFAGYLDKVPDTVMVILLRK